MALSSEIQRQDLAARRADPPAHISPLVRKILLPEDACSYALICSIKPQNGSIRQVTSVLREVEAEE